MSQNYPRIAIAVVDDGSTDATPALRERFPSAQWLRWDAPRGYLEARNEMMRGTDADYFLSLDDDAWLVSGDEAALAVDYLERHPAVAAIAFDILGPGRPRRAPRSEPLPAHMFIGCGHIVRLSAARAAGFYDPAPGAYGAEEKDLCLRLLDRGWDLRFLPGVHVWHEKTDLARDLAAQHRSGVCNDLVFALRRCPFPLVLAVLPGKLMSHLRFALRRGLFAPWLGGVGLFLRNVFPALASRRPVRFGTFDEFQRRSRGVS